MNKTFRNELKVATGILGALFATQMTQIASAQEAPATTDEQAASEETATGISEIVVTAQKRSENVQDVAATITAFGSEDLETRQIRSVIDLQTQVPSLQAGSLFGANLITLRGISTGITSGLADPSVATHINGVYQPRDRSIASAMVDLERVEVLSGPQGTLYGRNATGGAINYVLRGPSREFEGEITGRIANYDRMALSGSVSGPIAEGVGIRVTGLYDNQDKGFTRVLNADAPIRSIEENRSYGGRVIFRIEPTSRLSLDLEQIYLNTNPLHQNRTVASAP